MAGAGGRQAVELGRAGRCWPPRRARRAAAGRAAPGPAGPGEGRLEHLLHDRDEQPAQPALVVGRRAQVQRCWPRRAAPPGRCRRRRPGAGRSANGSSTVSAVVYTDAALALVALPGGPGRPEGLFDPRRLEQVEHLAHLLGVHPADDVGHRAAAGRRREQQRGQQLGRRRVPELAVGGGAPRPRHLGEVGGHPPGARPGRGRPERRPAVGRQAGRPGRVEAPDAPRGRVATARCAARRSVFTLAATTGPSQPRMAGHGEPGRLPALGRPDHRHRLDALGRRRPRRCSASRVGARRAPDPPGPRPGAAAPQVAPASPSGRPGVRAAAGRPELRRPAGRGQRHRRASSPSEHDAATASAPPARPPARVTGRGPWPRRCRRAARSAARPRAGPGTTAPDLPERHPAAQLGHELDLGRRQRRAARPPGRPRPGGCA